MIQFQSFVFQLKSLYPLQIWRDRVLLWGFLLRSLH